ncbi:calcitonin gene-related peptide type 1 receptor [Drosophila madeirensis]|uniref:Calcitonin gene-related peptide type 1 receptor n=1 Tax=Drosophila madeirensis TaxID=30013 RepID=A0AAU9G9Z8_DROMD
MTASRSLLEGWRNKIPFRQHRRQTIDNSRQQQPLMEERDAASCVAAAPSPAADAVPVAGGEADVASRMPTLMTTIAEDAAEQPAGETCPAPSATGIVIVRMEGAAGSHHQMADEAL